MSFTDKELAWIQDTAQGQVLEIDGEKYSTRKIHHVGPPDRPEQRALAVATLDGVVEYVEAHGLIPEGVVVHVEDFNRVRLVSVPFGDRFQRHEFAVATHPWPAGLKFDAFYTAEAFNIHLLSLYQHTDELDRLIAIAGNLRAESEVQQKDDGVTQKVSMATGISALERRDAPPFVELAPFRTFNEIDQPQSRFVFRVRQSPTGKGIECALFEADGGRWKGVAIERIKVWLREQLPEFKVVG